MAKMGYERTRSISIRWVSFSCGSSILQRYDDGSAAAGVPTGAGIATLIVGAPEPHFVAAGIKGIATAFPLQRILGRDRGPVAGHRDFVVFVLNLNLPIFCMKHNCS